MYLAEFLRSSVSAQLSYRTILRDKSCVGLFLDWAGCHHRDLSSVTLKDVETYLEAKRQTGWKPRTVASQCSILRRFFQYAFIRGWTDQRIGRGISRPRVSRYEEAPKGPAWKDVRKLLEFRSPDEARTRAMLFLCSIYALRASEVTNLTLDDFDWFNETLTVRRVKQGRIQQFPLQFEIGEAIIDYLRHGRPSCKCRNLFVTARPPYHQLSPQSLRNVIAQQMVAMGVTATRLGPHSLRHACATQLLRRGSSLHDIADFLGHKNMSSVCVYAKHDIRTLKNVAVFSLAGIR
jgi:site-specific recombinase XerD